MTQSNISRPVESYAEAWARVRGRLRSEAGEAAYGSWLKPLTLVSVKGGVARMAVPTRFMRDWVVGNYKQVILTLWRDEDDAILNAEIVVQPPRPKADEKALRHADGNRAAAPQSGRPRRERSAPAQREPPR